MEDAAGYFWIAALVLAVFGIIIPFTLAKTSILKKTADRLPTFNRIGTHRLVACDCGAETPCPQGRDPLKGGNPYRCKIWKAEKI